MATEPFPAAPAAAAATPTPTRARAPAPATATPASNRTRPRRPFRRWLPYLGAALIALLIALGFRPVPSPVEAAKAAIGPLRTSVSEEGRTRVRQRYVVSAPVSGQLRRIPFKAGAEVKAGETAIAVIDPIAPAPLDARTRSLAEARRDAARANLDKAGTAHRFAAGDLARFQKLFKDGTIAAQELEAYQWREAAASKDLTSAESALQQAEAELVDFGTATPGLSSARLPIELTAPASGRILRVLEENARVVAAGTPLVEIGDATDLEVVIEVLSRDGAAIAPGSRVELDQWGAPEPLTARVRLIEPAAFTKISALGVEEQRVRVIADLLTPAEKRASLGDAFRVEAHIITWETDRALKVPSGALFRRGGAWSAFVIDHGRAALRAIEAGRSGGSETEILKGLADGDTVILYPGDRVKEGDRVTAIQIAR